MKRQFLDQGLKPTTGYVCIRRLADKQCRIGSFYGRPCECRHPLFDHTSLYIKGGKPHTLVTQPYGLDNRDLAALLAMCEKYGLEIPFGHDPGDDESQNRSRVMQHYRTGGTPWFIFIDQKNNVVFNDFHLNVEKAITFLKTIE